MCKNVTYDILHLQKMDILQLCVVASDLDVDGTNKKKQQLIYEILDKQQSKIVR